MPATQIHIGTSGWSYQHWKGNFYPPSVPARNWLSYYAGHFSCTEVNGSFYRIPKSETVAAWADQTPPQFKFCAKMSRYLTHMKKLRDADEPLRRFFEAFAPMGKKMGPVLLQLPPQLPFRYPEIADFFRLLAMQYAGQSFVVEARHPSWLSSDALALMVQWQVGWVIAQSGVDFPYAESVTSANIYIRFHGPEQLYASGYSDAQLEAFAKRMLQWAAAGNAVWAFFNNDIGGHAPLDAQRLARMCGVGG